MARTRAAATATAKETQRHTIESGIDGTLSLSLVPTYEREMRERGVSSDVSRARERRRRVYHNARAALRQRPGENARAFSPRVLSLSLEERREEEQGRRDARGPCNSDGPAVLAASASEARARPRVSARGARAREPVVTYRARDPVPTPFALYSAERAVGR